MSYLLSQDVEGRSSPMGPAILESLDDDDDNSYLAGFFDDHSTIVTYNAADDSDDISYLDGFFDNSSDDETVGNAHCILNNDDDYHSSEHKRCYDDFFGVQPELSPSSTTYLANFFDDDDDDNDNNDEWENVESCFQRSPRSAERTSRYLETENMFDARIKFFVEELQELARLHGVAVPSAVDALKRYVYQQVDEEIGEEELHLEGDENELHELDDYLDRDLLSTPVSQVSKVSFDSLSLPMDSINKCKTRLSELPLRPIDQFKSAIFQSNVTSYTCIGKCPHHKRCLRRVPDEVRIAAISAMWGEEGAPASSAPMRRAYAREALSEAYSRQDKDFKFTLPAVGGCVAVDICEAAWLKIHGYKRRPSWYLIDRRRIMDNLDALMKFKSFRKKLKSMDIVYYIDKYKNERCDCLPVSDGDAEETTYKYCLPFVTISQFYKAFVYDNVENFLSKNEDGDLVDKLKNPGKEIVGSDLTSYYAKTLKLGSYMTFKRKLRENHSDVHFLKCKGSFPTCDVCVGASRLLNEKRRWTSIQRQAIFIWHKRHIEQQAAERENQARRIERAKVMNPLTGQPTYAYITADAMTDFTTRTPKFQRRGEKISKDDIKESKVQARVMGFHVVCGPYEGL